MTRKGTAVFVALVLMAGAAYSVYAADDDATREAKDRAQIEQLMWRYARALDTANPDAYAAAYTPDGQFSAGSGNATKGHEALKKMIADIRQRNTEAQAKGETRPPMYHMTTNEYLEFVGKDRARLHSYYITVFGAAGQNNPVRVAAAGRSIDELVRVNGKWLIQTRNVAPTTE
jgi:3-phenylpropionate/cinnamic acid dioxygenase small subunit